MTFARRLADAASAFVTGHSVRDRDRVRLQRMRLLASRMLAFDRRSIHAGEEALRELGLDVPSKVAALTDPTQRRIDELVQGLRGVAYAALLQQLYIHRDRIRCRAIDDALDRDAVDRDLVDTAILRFEALLVEPPAHYGKLYEGLAQEGIFDLCLRQARLSICNWHRRFLSLVAGYPAADAREAAE